MLPLTGITVVALEQAIAAPFATRQLADWGARVIKIERPGVGDFARDYDAVVNGLSSQFVWVNRSKESLTLDLKHAAAAGIMAGLLTQADVFIQNLAPGASDRLGLGAEQLLARYPRLIVCDLSGYGAEGPYRDKKAYDLLIQCETGMVSINGSAEAPAKVGIAVADIAAGMYAYTGILTALFQRERTGKGSVFAVSLLDALGEWMGYPLYYTAYSGNPPARAGAYHAVIVPYGPFHCGDGKTVFLGIQNQREWQRFCDEVLLQPELSDDPRFVNNSQRLANRDALHLILVQRFASLTAEALIAQLEAAGIANARLNSVQEFATHPQLQARNRWRTVDSPVGPLPALLPPVILRNCEAVMGAIPALGEHSDLILRELGYEDGFIQQLRAEGAI